MGKITVIIKQSLLFFSFVLYLFLGSFCVSREYMYTKESYALLATLTLSIMLIFLSKTSRIKVDFPRYNLLFLYFAILSLRLFASTLNFNALFFDNIIGLLNDSVTQMTFILLLIFLGNFGQPQRHDWLDFYSKLTVFFAVFATAAALQFLLTGETLFGPFHLENPEMIVLYGWFDSPNVYVTAAAFGLFSAIYRIQASENSFIYAFLSAILFVAIFLSGSRGGILATFLAIVFYLFLALLFRLSRKTIVALSKVAFCAVVLSTVCLCLFFAFLATNNHDLDWAVNTIVRPENISTGAGRLTLWSQSIEIFQNADFVRLLWGHGNGFIQSKIGRPPHSSHISVIIESGIIAYGCLWFLFGSIVLKAIKTKEVLPNEAFLIITSVAYIWFRTFFNSGLLSGRFTGLVFVYFVYFSCLSSRKVIENEN